MVLSETYTYIIETINLTDIDFYRFLIIYAVFLAVLSFLKKISVKKTNLMLIGGVRMTFQLIVAGLFLAYILGTSSLLLTGVYTCFMIIFAGRRIFSDFSAVHKNFKIAATGSIAFFGILITSVFIFTLNKSISDPMYFIPISGMMVGNSMTGVLLGMNAFVEKVSKSRLEIETLINMGVAPSETFHSILIESLETSLIPTINSMLGMGIVFLPGLMTGQILSGVYPLTAIFYQIGAVISIACTVSLSVYTALYLGSKTYYNKKQQFIPTHQKREI